MHFSFILSFLKKSEGALEIDLNTNISPNMPPGVFFLPLEYSMTNEEFINLQSPKILLSKKVSNEFENEGTLILDSIKIQNKKIFITGHFKLKKNYFKEDINVSILGGSEGKIWAAKKLNETQRDCYFYIKTKIKGRIGFYITLKSDNLSIERIANFFYLRADE